MITAKRDRERFTKHASPEAIAAYLETARRQLQRHERYVGWLERLLEQRTAEKTAGQWPAPDGGERP